MGKLIAILIFVTLASVQQAIAFEYLAKCRSSGGAYDGSCYCPASGDRINPYVDSCTVPLVGKIQAFLNLETPESAIKKYDDFCKSTRGLDELSAKALCSVSSDLYACRGLAASITGLMGGGGAAVAAPAVLKKMFVENLSKNRSKIAETLAGSLHDKWRGTAVNIDDAIDRISQELRKERGFTGRTLDNIVKDNNRIANQVSYLRTLKKNGTAKVFLGPALETFANFSDSQLKIANTPFDKLPKMTQEQYRHATSSIIDDIIRRVPNSPDSVSTLKWKSISGPQIRGTAPFNLLLENWGDGLAFRYEVSQSLKAITHVGTVSSQLAPEFVEQEIRSLFVGAGKYATLTSKLGLLGDSAGLLAKRVLPAVAAGAGAAVGALTLWTTTNSSEFCEEAQHEFMNVDERCQRQFSFNKNVMEFLSLPSEKKLALLANKNVCEFYKGLHASEFSVPFGVKVTDRGDGVCSATIKGREKHGDLTLTSQLDTAGSGKLELRSPAGRLTQQVSNRQLAGPEQFTSKDSMMTTSTATSFDFEQRNIRDTFRQVKFVLPDILECCKNNCGMLTPHELRLPPAQNDNSIKTRKPVQ